MYQNIWKLKMDYLSFIEDHKMHYIPLSQYFFSTYYS